MFLYVRTRQEHMGRVREPFSSVRWIRYPHLLIPWPVGKEGIPLFFLLSCFLLIRCLFLVTLPPTPLQDATPSNSHPHHCHHLPKPTPSSLYSPLHLLFPSHPLFSSTLCTYSTATISFAANFCFSFDIMQSIIQAPN